ELLELVIKEDLLNDKYFWYFPVELFYRLKDIDKARYKSTGTNLIQSVRFVPSSQRILYYQLKLLKADELEAFNMIIREGINSMPAHLEKFTINRQIIILDGLLAYQQYRLIAEEPNPSKERRKFKDQILLARLQLPAHLKESFKIQELPSPGDSSRPMVFNAGIGSGINEKPFLRLNWSPFKQEIVGQNSLEGDELVVFDLAVGFFEDEHKAFIDKFDLIRILNLNTLLVSAADESQWSWQLYMGVNRTEDNGEYKYDGAMSYGLGRAWKWNETVTGYGMVDFAAHTLFPFVRARPHLGLRFDLGKLRTWLYFGAESVNYDLEFRDIGGGKIQYSLSDQRAIYIELSNENATQASLGLSWYW
ncbi:MAG: hypothetical protein ABIH08_06895, partial [Candidatus Omnitrophota bacterium]